MISVIIPTMWRAQHIQYMLPMLDKHPLIGEIILIDNEKQSANLELINSIKKLVYLPQEQNIFVNPAWNLGAQLSKNNVLMFLNDDCLVNLNGLYKVYNEIDASKGLFGFSELSYCGLAIEMFDSLKRNSMGDYVTIEESYGTDELSGMPHFSYGSVMLCHKESYYEIPEEFKIYFGDLFIYTMNRVKGKKNYVIEDGLVLTKMSSTVSSANPQIEKERQVFYDVFKRYGINC